jgi:hypothetical protein
MVSEANGPRRSRRLCGETLSDRSLPRDTGVRPAPEVGGRQAHPRSCGMSVARASSTLTHRCSLPGSTTS